MRRISRAPSDAATAAVQVFRPNAAAYWARVGTIGRIVLGGAVVIGVPLLVLGVHSTRIVVIVATIAGLGVVIGVYIRNVRLEVDPQEVRLYGMFGGVKRWSRFSIHGFTVLEVVFRGIGRNKPIAFAYGSDHRALFTLEASLWALEELRAIGDAIADSTTFETLSNKEAVKRYPGCMSFADRHYWLVGGSIPFVIIGLVFVLAPFCAPDR